MMLGISLGDLVKNVGIQEKNTSRGCHSKNSLNEVELDLTCGTPRRSARWTKRMMILERKLVEIGIRWYTPRKQGRRKRMPISRNGARKAVERRRRKIVSHFI